MASLENRTILQKMTTFFKQWLFRHRAADAITVTLTQRRVFILPTRQGMLAAGTLLALLLASINYQLNLGFALTFFVGAIGVVGILHTFRNLVRLRIQAGIPQPTFAGQLASFPMMLHNDQATDRYALECHVENLRLTIDLSAHNQQQYVLEIPAVARGWQSLPRVTLSTVFPLGWWRAWAYWYAPQRCLVYPTPETNPPPLPEHAHMSANHSDEPPTKLSAPINTEPDLAGIRPYQAGDTLRQIAWKAIARQPNEQLLTRMLEAQSGYLSETTLWFDWSQLPSDLGTEARLSRLTAWLLIAEEAVHQPQYGLRLPAQAMEGLIPPARGAEHLHRCLRALALF